MRVFVTGATGFVGAAVVDELLAAGHQVLGLVRSDEAARVLERKDAKPHRGDLNNLVSLMQGVEECDGVIHTAYNHDFTKFAEAAETDRKVIETLGAAVARTGASLVVTSGIGALPSDQPVSESDDPDPNSPVAIRAASERTALALSSLGVRSSVVRLPPIVHDQSKQGLATRMIALARQTGVSAYVRGGLNRWPTVHRLDAAQLFRLALESAVPGSTFHAIGEDGVYLRGIAEAIGKLVNVPTVSKTPEEAASHFGFLAYFVAADFQVSSTNTKRVLGWEPTRPGVLEDIDSAR